jgi:hypothetical protein
VLIESIRQEPTRPTTLKQRLQKKKTQFEALRALHVADPEQLPSEPGWVAPATIMK